jgi:predicted kinase
MRHADIHGPIIILIRGLPGSGKSYLANALQDTLGADNVVMLDPDAIDKEAPAYKKHSQVLAAEGIEEKFHPFRFLRAQARQAIIDKKIAIWNQPFSDPGGYARTLESLRTYAAEQQASSPILLVEVEVTPEIAKARVADRKEQGGHGPSPRHFDTYASGHTSFADKGQDHTVTVGGKGDVSTSVATVMDALQKLAAESSNL